MNCGFRPNCLFTYMFWAENFTPILMVWLPFHSMSLNVRSLRKVKLRWRMSWLLLWPPVLNTVSSRLNTLYWKPGAALSSRKMTNDRP